MNQIKNNDEEGVESLIFEYLRTSPEIPFRFMFGVLGIQIREITSDVTDFQVMIMSPNYEESEDYQEYLYNEEHQDEDEG
jgi:hypothetical protein